MKQTLSLAVTVMATIAGNAFAQQPYPTRAVRIIVPSTPGGGTDATARYIAPKLTEFLGQPVVVENRPGAAMVIGAEIVARAAPDGHTLLMGVGTFTINPSMRKKLPYDTIRDFAPVSLIVSLPNVLVSHPSLPTKNVKELIAFARARPGELNYGSVGVGSSVHMAMELFLNMTQLKVTHVAYKGSSVGLIDVMSGQIAMMMPTLVAGLPHIASGRVRAYGVTTAKRATGAPQIPTIDEAGVPGYVANNWFGLLATGGTPPEIVNRLHAGVVRALQDADLRKRFIIDGAEPVGSTPDEFAAVIRSDIAKWAKVIKDAGIKPE